MKRTLLLCITLFVCLYSPGHTSQLVVTPGQSVNQWKLCTPIRSYQDLEDVFYDFERMEGWHQPRGVSGVALFSKDCIVYSIYVQAPGTCVLNVPYVTIGSNELVVEKYLGRPDQRIWTDPITQAQRWVYLHKGIAFDFLWSARQACCLCTVIIIFSGR